MMGRGKREEWKRAFSLFPSSPRAFYFFRLLLFLLAYPAGAFAEEEGNPAATRIREGKRINLTTHCSQVLLHIK